MSISALELGLDVLAVRIIDCTRTGSPLSTAMRSISATGLGTGAATAGSASVKSNATGQKRIVSPSRAFGHLLHGVQRLAEALGARGAIGLLLLHRVQVRIVVEQRIDDLGL